MSFAQDAPVPPSAADSQASGPPELSPAPAVSPPVDPSLVDPDGRVRKFRHRRKRVVEHYKVDELLQPEDREEYERMLHDPRSTNKALQRWLAERGYTVGVWAISNHRRHFLRDVQGVREAAKMANAFAGLVRVNGAGVMAEASQARYEQLFMQNLFTSGQATHFTPKDWVEMGRAMSGIVNARRQVEEMRDEFKRRADEALRALREEEEGDEDEPREDLVTRVERILETGTWSPSRRG